MSGTTTFGWVITRDHFDNCDVRKGQNLKNQEDWENVVQFRMYDDDMELMYSGILADDDYAESQTSALQYGMTDVGATVIKVKRGNKWVQDIA